MMSEQPDTGQTAQPVGPGGFAEPQEDVEQAKPDQDTDVGQDADQDDE
jgi:hypothetical protein